MREAAGVIDLSAFAQFMLSGADAHRLLDRLSANRLPVEDRRIALSHFLTERGRFESEMTITRLAHGRYFLGSAIAGHYKDRDWLMRHLHSGECVTIDDLTPSWGMLALSGPRSRAILETGVEIDVNNAALPWLRGCETRLFGVEGILLRVSFTGELGYELHVPMASLADVYNAVLDAGARHGLRDIGSHALNSLRLEKAYRASAELTADVGLVEAGMLRFFRPQNRSFLGRDATLERIEHGGDWRLVYLAIEAQDADALGGEAILDGDRAIGMVTSGGFGHSVGRSLAFGYIRPSPSPGARLAVQVLGERCPARILDSAVYDANNERLRM